jgi:hypothetical protein
LPEVCRCPSAISREGAKPRKWGLKRHAQLRQTLPLPEESTVFKIKFDTKKLAVGAVCCEPVSVLCPVICKFPVTV